ncbi:MAG: nuclear transport factor 2 family protein [Gammaproteobacteria bacterium]|nr:nuclear transport factor 2 family protein [Gammaproteobacteria bacterium]
MSDKNLNAALAYYQAMNDKNLDGVAKYLHPEVTLLSPLAEVLGKEAALQAAKGFCAFMKKITIRAQFSAQDQVMLAFDIDFPAPIGVVRSAVLMSFKDDLIYCNEMFYDPRALESNKGQIFRQN